MVIMAMPLRLPVGTVAVIWVSLTNVNAAGYPGPKDRERRQAAGPNPLPEIVTFSPALASSGVTDLIFGASPKQACAWAAVSADVYLGAWPLAAVVGFAF